MPSSISPATDRIAVLGLGFVGLPLAATLAEVGFEVTGVDVSPRVLEALKNGKTHFEEAGLQQLLDRVLGNKLTIQDQLPKERHNIYIITVGTPVSKTTYKPMMKYVESAAEMVGQVLEKGDLVILRSTVPVGATTQTAQPILEQESGLKAGEDFYLAFAPERLVAGKALQELRELPQLVGATSQTGAEKTSQLFKHLTEAILDVGKPEAAEMAKIIDNTYRDLRFAYANQMARIAEGVGVDMVALAKAVNFGYPRNQVPTPSPGVGGACLTKDPYILALVGQQCGYEPKLSLAARQVNEEMPAYVAEKMARLLKEAGKKPKESTVCVLGFAFKGNPETSDLRDSASLELVHALQELEVTIIGHDPAVPTADIEAQNVRVVSIEDGFKEADAVIVMTNHLAYDALNIKPLLESMKKPAVFIDGWHLFEPSEIKAVDGILYGGVGND